MVFQILEEYELPLNLAKSRDTLSNNLFDDNIADCLFSVVVIVHLDKDNL